MGKRPPSDDEQSPDDTSGMPTTAFLVLGMLCVSREELTAGEIKVRADYSVGQFYWSPAVSHIRKELGRLLERGLVAERVDESGQRDMKLYSSTKRGDAALKEWAERLPGTDDVVIKHPLMLKIWLAVDSEPEALIEAIDQYTITVQRKIDVLHWGRRRAIDLKWESNRRLPYTQAVSDYELRYLYAELSNIRHLRDAISWYSAERPLSDIDLPKGMRRPRAETLDD